VSANLQESVSLQPAVIKKYFTAEQSKEEIQKTIEEALKLYFGM